MLQIPAHVLVANVVIFILPFDRIFPSFATSICASVETHFGYQKENILL